VSLGAPRPGTGGAEWECPFRIHGAGISRIEFGYGVDSMQALTTALDGIHALLDESGLPLGWWTGPGRHDLFSDETGFARQLPRGFGAAFRRRLERLVDGELRQWVQRLKRRSARTKKPTAKKARRPPAPPRKSRKAG
jgi:hypothetical protein